MGKQSYFLEKYNNKSANLEDLENGTIFGNLFLKNINYIINENYELHQIGELMNRGTNTGKSWFL